MKFVIFTVLFSVFSILAFSQSPINFNGKILSTSGFVYNVNIVNKKIYKGTVSDFGGNFAMPVSTNDTIIFSSIGYKKFTYIIPDTIQGDNHRVIVQLVEDTFLLKETIITPWPLRGDFQEAFLKARPKTEKEAIATYAGFREIEGDPTPPPPTIMNPISFIANIFSPKRIREKKMNRIRKKLQED